MPGDLMPASHATRNIVCLDCVDSTNLVAKQLGAQGAPHMTLVLADRQTQGRGRRGRSWVSPPGQGICMTLIVRPDIEPQRAPELVMLTAVALCGALRTQTGCDDIVIKWPNDVLCNGKKLCGTLLELSLVGERPDFAVIGVGINVLGTEFPKDLPDAASLQSATGQTLRRGDVVEAFLNAFEPAYALWARGGMDAIMPEYSALCQTLGARVRVLCPQDEYEGVAEAVAHDGALLLRMNDGELRTLYAGDVSIRHST